MRFSSAGIVLRVRFQMIFLSSSTSFSRLYRLFIIFSFFLLYIEIFSFSMFYVTFGNYDIKIFIVKKPVSFLIIYFNSILDF